MEQKTITLDNNPQHTYFHKTAHNRFIDGDSQFITRN